MPDRERELLHLARQLAQSGHAAMLALNSCSGERNGYLREIASGRVAEFMRYYNEIRNIDIPG